LVASKFTGALPAQLIADEPKFTVATPVVAERCKLAAKVKLKFPVLKVPAIALIEKTVTALTSVHAPFAPLKTTPIAPNVTLLVAIVFPVVVAIKLTLAPVVDVNTTPVAAFIQLPEQLITAVAPDVIVTLPIAGPAIVMSSALAFVPTVTA
jgi:hypothetical protein